MTPAATALALPNRPPQGAIRWFQALVAPALRTFLQSSSPAAAHAKATDLSALRFLYVRFPQTGGRENDRLGMNAPPSGRNLDGDGLLARDWRFWGGALIFIVLLIRSGVVRSGIQERASLARLCRSTQLGVATKGGRDVTLR
jgi:hypothetical protein